jgi:hypothetical protein
MPAQLCALEQQLLACAQQIPILFLLGVWWLHDGHQPIGVELRQLAGSGNQ